MMSKSVYAVCGERSGDVILRRIRRQVQQSSNVRVIGGVWTPDDTSLSSSSVLFDGPKELGVMGAGWDVLSSIPRAYMRLKQTESTIRGINPDVLLTVDSKGFSLRLQDRIRRVEPEVKRIHLCAPSIWAFKDGLRKAKRMVPLERLCTLLPFEHAYWSHIGRGDEVQFCGYFAVETLLDVLNVPTGDVIEQRRKEDVSFATTHPPLPHEIPLEAPSGKLPTPSAELKQRAKQNIFACFFPDFDLSTPLLVLAPGSRHSIVRDALPIMNSMVQEFSRRHSRCAVLVLSSEDKEVRSLVNNFVSYFSPPIQPRVADERTDKVNVLLASNAAFAVSGTMVTEFLLFNVPTVVMYNGGGRVTELLAKQLSRVHWMTLCNIMAGEHIVPEFLFNKCNDVKVVCDTIENVLFDQGNAELLMQRVHPYLNQLITWNGTQPVRPSAIVSDILASL